MAKNDNSKLSKLKITIIILCVLLVLSLGALAIRHVQLKSDSQPSPATVQGNIISESKRVDTQTSENQSFSPSEISLTDAASDCVQSSEPKEVDETLELWKGKDSDNTKFEATGILPGDTVTKTFCVKAFHDEKIDVIFKTEITDQSKNLSDVLKIKVTDLRNDKVLIDAPFSEVNRKEFPVEILPNENNETILYYNVEVSLDTSVGNEYQASFMKADFDWYVNDDSGLSVSPNTGDATDITLWSAVAVLSFLVLLFSLKYRKEALEHGTEE